MIENVAHLLVEMKLKGLYWANITYEALHIKSSDPLEVIKAKLEKFDRLFNRNSRNSFRSRGYRGRSRGYCNNYNNNNSNSSSSRNRSTSQERNSKDFH